MKRCYKCKETKDLTKFSKCSRNKDGLQSKCKACEKQYFQDNKEKAKVYYKQYRRDNKDKIRNYKKQHILRNIPCVYKIESKISGLYYIGSTTLPLCYRIAHHFNKTTCSNSPFTGKDRDNWEWYELCTGTKEEVRELEKYLLSVRVGIDKNCINKRIG
jgi:hypothetical protein